MNFDDIQKNWQSEGEKEVKIPASIDQLRKAKHPIEIVKANMKKEFYMQLIAILLIPFLVRVSKELIPMFLVAYIVFALIGAYYLYHFYKFYKQMHNYSIETKDGLLELYYQLRLNMERYKSFGFLLLPFIYIFIALIFYQTPKFANEGYSMLLNKHQYLLIFIVISVSLFYIAMIAAWVKKFYGRYAMEIKEVLEELKEE